MNERKNKIRAGIFVTLTVLLFLVMLFFLGASDLFVRKAGIVTCFAESVQGLNVGSEVRFLGVKVGTVREISILAEEKLIEVELDIELKCFDGIDVADDSGVCEEKFYEFIQSEIQNGLRCSLEFVGITGMKYVSLDYYEKNHSRLVQPPFAVRKKDLLYVPSVNSSFKDIMVAMTSALDRLSNVKFEAIFTQVENVLKELNTTLSAPEIAATLKHVQQITSNLERTSATMNNVFKEDRVNEFFNQMEQSVKNINTLSTQLSNITEKMKLPETAAGVRDASGAVVETRQELAETIIKLNSALEALRKLCETVNNEPGVLFGAERAAE